MNISSFTLAAALTSATALGAFAADTIKDDGNRYEDAAEVSGQYVYDRDTYEINGKSVTNVGGEIRSEQSNVVDEDTDTQMSQTEATSIENIVVAAEQGASVSTSDDQVFGTVAYTQEMSNGYRVFVTIDPASEVPASMIGFDASSLEVKTVGSGLEFGGTLDYLREEVASRM